MAQRKRDQDQLKVVGQDVSVSLKPGRSGEKNTVPDLLLHYHRTHLLRRVANRISSRALFLTITLCLIMVNRVSLISLIGSVGAASLLAFIWYSERGILEIRQRALEKILAERSGEEWEDTYIQFKYHTSKPIGRYKTSTEPFIWAVLIFVLGMLRFYFERKLGS